MGKIPLYQSNERLITTAPQAVRQSPQAAGQAGRDLEGAGEAIAGAHDTIRKAYDFQQVGTAKVKALEGMSALEQRALSDGDNTGDFTQYDGEIKRIKTETLAGISNPAVRSKFEMDFDLQAAQTKTAITSVFRKNMVSKGLANLGTMNEYFVNEYAKTGDKSYIDNMNLNIDTYVKQGFIGADDAQKLKLKTTLEAKYNNFLSEFRANPIESEEKFNAGGYGLDIETSEKARVRLKEVKAINREAEGELYGDLSLKVQMGQASDEMINQAIAINRANPNEGITEAHGKTLKSALYKDITKRIGTKEYKKHKNAIDFVFSNSTQDRVKGYEAILAAYEDGLTSDESAFLTKILKTKQDVLFANKAASGKKMLEQLFGARPKDVAYETKSLLSYAKRIANGIDPEQAAQETMLDVIKEDHPAVVANPDLAGAFTPSKGYKSIPKVKQEKK